MLGRPLYRFDRVTSTMDVLGGLAAAGAPEGTTVVAGFQEAGRGRGSRRWVVPPGRALLASVLLRPDVPLHRLMPLSILVADAVRAAVGELYGLEACVKWPNDVLIDGRKLSGVLLQTKRGPKGLGVIVGFGINANVAPADLPPTGTSLLAEIGHPVDRDALLGAVLSALEMRYRELHEGRLESRWLDLDMHLAMRGEQVVVEDAGRTITGRLVRIDRDGALVLQADDSEHRIVAGDLGRGPRAVDSGGVPAPAGKPGILS